MSSERKGLELPSIILASTSPRRRELLRQIGVTFTIIPPDTEEIAQDGEDPKSFVQRLAYEKAMSVASMNEDQIVLGSDTIVVLDNLILGKPIDRADAFRMLSSLSGRTHTVFTGYSLIRTSDSKVITGLGQAEVTFRELTGDEIEAYIDSGSPMDKAGSYGIQEDLGAVFIERIDGDYYTVVGLPLTKVYLALRSFDQ